MTHGVAEQLWKPKPLVISANWGIKVITMISRLHVRQNLKRFCYPHVTTQNMEPEKSSSI